MNLDESHFETIRITLVFILKPCGCCGCCLFSSPPLSLHECPTIFVSVSSYKKLELQPRRSSPPSRSASDHLPPPPFRTSCLPHEHDGAATFVFLHGYDDVLHVVFLIGRPMLISWRAKAIKASTRCSLLTTRRRREGLKRSK